MRIRFGVVSLALVAGMFAVTVGAVRAQETTPKQETAPKELKVGFAPDIAAYVKADETEPPQKGQILFIGSSIFRQWTQLKEQMAPLPVFNRAFGGSRTWEVLHYADQIVFPYEPKIIVYYCGSNDINSGENAQGIFDRYRQFSEAVQEKLPKTKVYFVSILRAPQKQDHWDIVDAANQLVHDYSTKTKNRGFIDINPVVFDKDGKPRMELYQPDKLHYKPETYTEFTAVIKPVLEGVWKKK